MTEAFRVSSSMWSLSLQPREGWYAHTTGIAGIALVLLSAMAVSATARFLLIRPILLNREVEARTVELKEANYRLGEEISSKTLAQNELAETEARIRRIYELAPIGIAMIGPDGQFLAVNRFLQDMLGYSEEELLAMQFQDITAADKSCADRLDTERFQEMVCGAFDTAQLEKQYVRKDGGLANVNLTIAAVRDERGRFLHTITLVEDITQRLRLEASVRQSEKMQAIGTLAGGIAHDFNNVLSIVRGTAQLLACGPLDEQEVIECAQTIDRTGAQAQDLIRQILTFSRVEDTPRRPRPLAPMLKDALQLLRATLPASVSIVEHQECHDVEVNMTPTEVHRILMNLGSNAAAATMIRYSLPGGAS